MGGWGWREGGAACDPDSEGGGRLRQQFLKFQEMQAAMQTAMPNSHPRSR